MTEQKQAGHSSVDKHLVDKAIFERVRPEEDNVADVYPVLVGGVLAANPLELVAEHVWVGVHAVRNCRVAIGVNRCVNQIER